MTVSLRQSLVLRPGSVLQSYPGLRLGNYLYFALRAHTEREGGRRTWVLDSGLDPRWKAALPNLGPLLADPRTAAFRRRRYIPHSFLQGFESDFTRAELERFIAAIVLPERPRDAAGPEVVVNVRRGDYYANPDFRRLYGFDTADYVQRAIRSAASERVGWLSVISDDPAWCQTHLAYLKSHADRVTFGAQISGPVGDFWEVASAPNLVLTNSTFSYWAAYVSQTIHGAAHRGVWVPALHQRNVHGGRPWQHDPRWHALEVSSCR